jgi:putative transposase
VPARVEGVAGALTAADVQISMDCRGRWMDNVFVERLWRSVKHEEVYLHAYDDGAEARAVLGAYFDDYDTQRRHQALERQTRDELYHRTESLPQAARHPGALH